SHVAWFAISRFPLTGRSRISRGRALVERRLVGASRSREVMTGAEAISAPFRAHGRTWRDGRRKRAVEERARVSVLKPTPRPRPARGALGRARRGWTPACPAHAGWQARDPRHRRGGEQGAQAALRESTSPARTPGGVRASSTR